MKKITISVVAILMGLTTLGTNVPTNEKTNDVKYEIILSDTKTTFNLYDMTRNIKIEKEKYINDIPFNTKKIARKYLRQINKNK